MLKFEWLPITETEYDYALGAVPPRMHYAAGFLLGEPYSGRACTVTGKGDTTFAAFKIAAGECFKASEPLTVAEFKTALGRPL